ncbi:YacL family protein [Candidatus Sodalis sp. SoCistrobi]|uniref:YacL family protein n=1 Tax=Candidatus Sodalis sp. SoCistrobi TaxID=1922216 RepID=UPI00093F9018|nr:YacL family protein [Candidatus Sodalis sp. SoCistrobi]
MEYEFLRDVTGQVIVKFSMGHEAIGHWLNDEVKGDLARVADVERQLHSLSGSLRQWQHIGHEFTLLIDAEEVMVRANGMSVECDALEEGLSYYDEESLSLCGSDDFLLMLSRYRQFIQTGG